MEKTLTAQKWESPPPGKHIVPVAVIGVAAAALVIGMNYQFMPDSSAPIVAQAPASEPVAIAPELPAPTPTARAAGVESAPVERAKVATPEPARAARPRAQTPLPPRLAPSTIAPRAPTTQPAPEVREPRQEPAPTPRSIPAPPPQVVEPTPSSQTPQPLPEPVAPQLAPVPPLPSTPISVSTS